MRIMHHLPTLRFAFQHRSSTLVFTSPGAGEKLAQGGGERGAEDAAREGLAPDMKAAWLAARTAVAAQEYVHGTVAAAQCQQTNRGRLQQGRRAETRAPAAMVFLGQMPEVLLSCANVEEY